VSWDAERYVLGLTRDRISKRHSHFLLVLACHHQSHRPTFWPSHKTLAEELFTDVRDIRRIVAELESMGILSFVAGKALGKPGSYKFMELRVNQPCVEKVTEGGTEGGTEGKNDPALKETQDQNITKTKTPLTPLSGGNSVQPLTARQIDKLNEQITVLQRRHLDQFGFPKRDDHGKPIPALDFAEALELACAQLMFPIEAAWLVAHAAGLGEAKKSPQRVAG
jgi:hypothetical protein